MKKQWKKAVSLLLCMTTLFVFGGCGADDDYVYCDSVEERSYYWEEQRERIFGGYPRWMEVFQARQPCLYFDNCRDFYRTIRWKSLSEEDKTTILSEEHGGKVAIPRLSEIRALYYDSKRVDTNVQWFGCSDYILSVASDGVILPFRVHHYGYRSMSMEEYEDPANGYKKKVFFENDIEYTQYTKVTCYVPDFYEGETPSETFYQRDYLWWEFTEGKYSYRICEKWLSLPDADESAEPIMRLADIEIEVDGDYYYLMLGYYTSEPCVPVLTRETVSKFTMRSIW